MSDITFDIAQYPTLHAASLSQAVIRTIRGPQGSAKTTWAFMELLRRACEQEPNEAGSDTPSGLSGEPHTSN